mmetsp:Transcript_43090/g.114314  ORF Transcript_43090/g.114314 Transcript_43090/m.114314 type:complete len:254 (+) Transcript_43090:3-764(+)
MPAMRCRMSMRQAHPWPSPQSLTDASRPLTCSTGARGENRHTLVARPPGWPQPGTGLPPAAGPRSRCGKAIMYFRPIAAKALARDLQKGSPSITPSQRDCCGDRGPGDAATGPSAGAIPNDIPSKSNARVHEFARMPPLLPTPRPNFHLTKPSVRIEGSWSTLRISEAIFPGPVESISKSNATNAHPKNPGCFSAGRQSISSVAFVSCSSSATSSTTTSLVEKWDDAANVALNFSFMASTSSVERTHTLNQHS